MGFIYCFNFVSGKKYIGQTKRSPYLRLNEHMKCLGNCVLLERAISKYGKDNFTFEVLMEVNDNNLDFYEIKLIDLYDTIEPNGYNIRSGGVVSKHSELSRERMSIAKKGERNHNFGKPRTPETKKAISLAKSGSLHHFYQKTLSTEHKLALSKSHKKTNPELPMYLVYVKPRPHMYNSAGYAIINHPSLKTKYFTSKKFSEEEKLKLALEYLNTA